MSAVWSRGSRFGATRRGDDSDEHHETPANHGVDGDCHQVRGLEAVRLRSAVAKDALEWGHERSTHGVDEADESRLCGRTQQFPKETSGDKDVDHSDDEADDGCCTKVVAAFLGNRNWRWRGGRSRNGSRLLNCHLCSHLFEATIADDP